MKKSFIGALLAIIMIAAVSAELASAKGPFNRETPVVRAVREAGPAVVNIRTEQVVTRRHNPFQHFGGSDFFDEFFRDFFDEFNQDRTYASLGSGVIIDGKKGLILTNEHVVQMGSKIKVSLDDEKEYDAEIVGSDPDSDLAILQIKAGHDLPALDMGDSSNLMIGETVIAIGNPFGLNNTVTTGVISAVDRSFRTGRGRTFRDFIQTDASINPGNSGGPLLDINAQLIGINTAIYDKAEGIGFAIPINKAKRIVRNLISYGEVQAAWLGLSIQSMDTRLARYFGSPNENGVIITAIDRDGPAAGSDVKKGDVILKIDHHKIEDLEDYEDILKNYTADDAIKLTVSRKAKSLDINIKSKAFPTEKAVKLGWERYGLSVAKNSRSRGAVFLHDVRAGSSADKIGLRRGDYLLQVNEIKTDTVDQYIKAMTRYRFRQGISAIVQRGRQAYRITLTP